MKKMRLVLISIAIALTGCGSKINGTYANNMGSYTFNGDGTVIQEAMGMKIEMKYELDGKNVKLLLPQGAMIMTFVDERTLTGPMGMKFTKKN